MQILSRGMSGEVPPPKNHTLFLLANPILLANPTHFLAGGRLFSYATLMSRSAQLDKVTDKALETLNKTVGGTFFRGHLSEINFDVGIPYETSISNTVSSSSSSSTPSKTNSKRRLTLEEKHYIDGFVALVLKKTGEQTKEEFLRYLGRTSIRSKLKDLDQLFFEQPKLFDGNRVPGCLPTDFLQLMRGERMRKKLTDKEGLERLLAAEQLRGEKLQSELSRDRELLKHCENGLERKASIIQSMYGSAQSFLTVSGKQETQSKSSTVDEDGFASAEDEDDFASSEEEL